MLRIEDIAHALSCQPRFGGHLLKPYSVAQHSVMCAKHVIKSEKFAALMHDASEAYLLDMPSPIKTNLKDYKKFEKRLMVVIAKTFDFQFPLSEAVHIADRQMLEFEWNHLVIGVPLPKGFKVWTQKRAEKEFLKMYHKLKK